MNVVSFLASATELGGGPATTWDPPGVVCLKLLAIIFLVLLNGFFVASEFAIVKVRGSQLDSLAAEGNGRSTSLPR
jgi:Cyclin M transmembrane N-terminal domain